MILNMKEDNKTTSGIYQIKLYKAMGGCFGKKKNPAEDILKKAYQVFSLFDKNKKNEITISEIQKHFGSYSEASAKILLREIDLDNDGIITLNEWIGYWEMVRRSGYSEKQIMKQLNNIQASQLTLNFPNTKSYEEHLPRSTVVMSIVDDLKRLPPQTLPFSIQQ